MLVAQNADGHAGAGDGGEFHGAGEPLVALRIIIFQPDLEFDCLERVALLLVQGVVEEFFDVGCGSGLVVGITGLGRHSLLTPATVIFDMMGTVFQKNSEDSYGEDLQELCGVEELDASRCGTNCGIDAKISAPALSPI